MGRSLRILLDVDGVLAQTSEKILRLYNEKYGQKVEINDLIFWTYEDCPKITEKASDFFIQKGFFKDLDVFDGAQEMVRALLNQGHDIVIATAVFCHGYKDRYDWLRNWFPEISEENYVFTARKDLLVGDVILDDKVANLLNSNISYPVLMDRPWNNPSSYPESRCITRVKSFEEFVVYVQTLSAKEEKCG